MQSLSLELEGNATVSNRKLEEIWKTMVDCSFNACSTKQPVGISSALLKVSAICDTGTIISFSNEEVHNDSKPGSCQGCPAVAGEGWRHASSGSAEVWLK